MALVVTSYIAITIFSAFFLTETIIKKLENNPITKKIDEWNNQITKEEIKTHKPKPGEVDIYINGKFETIAKDGKKKILNIIEGLTEKKSVVILVEVATAGIGITIIDTLFFK